MSDEEMLRLLRQHAQFHKLTFLGEVADRIDALTARVAELEKDAARYRWLRERINWSDGEYSISTARTAPALSRNLRQWIHCDFRQNPPASEHIDEYIDGALAGADSAVQK